MAVPKPNAVEPSTTKRKLSLVDKASPVPNAATGSASTRDLNLSSSKKAKVHHDDTSEDDDLDEEITASESKATALQDVETDFLPLSDTKPNILYGFADALLNLFDSDGDENPPFYQQKKVLGAYEMYKKAKKGKPEPGSTIEQPEWDNDDDEEAFFEAVRQDYAAISIDEEDQTTKHVEALEEWFSNTPKGTWWYEVSLTRKEPVDNLRRVKVSVGSSRYDQEGYNEPNKDWGLWWMTLTIAEGESLKAMETVMEWMF